ncbi:ABC transporter permease [Rubrivivax benzoatilyticus]|uniref:ABC transporter permease n=1 Tax=Rubrivivax benzoatilyticus TaxID=316997 RepID=A0ABX0HZT5_9BURK|nr:ABC transporter permease [Rubrivivax benzoatilyticus]NHK98859.1 ABC transporter permease [Rubrivivax benzoatilyticus]NHL24361.1 ABC transporter permease [Rubrivivax benzoatilyticus]
MSPGAHSRLAGPAGVSFAARARRSPGFVLGALLVGSVLLLALVSLVWTPWAPDELDIGARLQPPSAAHWLGTDSLGRDIVSLLMAGAQTSLLVGVVAVAIGLVLGVTLGCVAAARRGWLDELLMRAADFTFAFPALLSAILLAAVYGPGLATSVVAIGLYNVPVFARVTRGAALGIWAREYVLAARAAGKGGWRITLDHVLPNIAAALVVQATIAFATAILAEAALSYLGLGTQPPRPSWGRMLNEAQTQWFQAPMQAVYPGLAIMTTVLGLNLLGDALRDLLDPRLARGRAVAR